MKQTQQVKAETRQAILAQAATMLRERGIANTSVADIMKAANLTHGGFYRHFDSKEALVVEVTKGIFKTIVDEFETRSAVDVGSEVVRQYIEIYLSKDHVVTPSVGCPIPTLGLEVSRLSDEVRTSFGQGIEQVVEQIALRLPEPRSTAVMRARQLLACLVGTIVIARATHSEKVADEALAACRELFNFSRD